MATEPQPIFRLVSEDWRVPSRWAALVADEERHYYWSDDWSPEFYAGQAAAGFIAVTWTDGMGTLLLPELQTGYAVLDWPDLHVGRTVRRRLRDGELSLVWNPDPAPVLDRLAELRGSRSWIRPPYRDVLVQLAQHPLDGVRVFGIELWKGGALAAGELGYTVGATYTSLSGFVDPAAPFAGLGTAQLVLLARDLERKGYAFWNLGHPHMEYKFALGAHFEPRRRFLERWAAAVRRQPSSDSSSASGS